MFGGNTYHLQERAASRRITPEEVQRCVDHGTRSTTAASRRAGTVRCFDESTGVVVILEAKTNNRLTTYRLDGRDQNNDQPGPGMPASAVVEDRSVERWMHQLAPKVHKLYGRR